MVMGIIGKTQGVKIESRPNPNATRRKAPNPCSAAALVAGGAASPAAGGLASE